MTGHSGLIGLNIASRPVIRDLATRHRCCTKPSGLFPWLSVETSVFSFFLFKGALPGDRPTNKRSIDEIADRGVSSRKWVGARTRHSWDLNSTVATQPESGLIGWLIDARAMQKRRFNRCRSVPSVRMPARSTLITHFKVKPTDSSNTDR